MIRVSRGAEIVVRFANRLAMPASVHWHGIRLDNRFDGVPGVTQEPVPPGGSFEYRIRFPDGGIYWYHPHHREDVLQDLGLYGNLLVDATGAFRPVDREVAVVLDDILVADAGLVPWGEETATHALMGRFGNLPLINGEPEWELDVARGEVVRLYLTNVSNARTWNVSLPGVRMKLVGTDVGRFEREEWVESVAIAPAERYVVEARFETRGGRAAPPSGARDRHGLRELRRGGGHAGSRPRGGRSGGARAGGGFRRPGHIRRRRGGGRRRPRAARRSPGSDAPPHGRGRLAALSAGARSSLRTGRTSRRSSGRGRCPR